MDSEPDKWFWDRVSPYLVQLHAIENVLYTGSSQFQKIEIIRSPSYGQFLVLDGKIQSSEGDEFIYHEALVQPPMITHPAPEAVFIAGGGEGATLREVLKHPSVRRAVMVDIDQEVVRVCQEYLPHYSQGAFQDRRTELLHTDARQYLAASPDRYDVIIIDLPEPIEEGPAYLLYTQEFYRLVSEHLTPDGVISVQSGSAALFELLNLRSVLHTLRSVFPTVAPYYIDVPSFGGPWGFSLASRTLDARQLTAEEVDRRLAERGLGDLRCYDGQTHQAMFSLPRHLRTELDKPGRLITDDSPLYLYRS